MKRIFIVLPLAVMALGACGKIGPLEPAPGASLPVQAYGQDEPVDPEALIAPSPQARPDRSDELLRKSEPREFDPFDLPPGGPPAPVGEEEESEQEIALPPE